VTILTNYSKQLPGKNLLARFSIRSLGNTKLNICCANLIMSILQVWNSFIKNLSVCGLLLETRDAQPDC